MPKYDYSCKTCNKTMEIEHGMTENAPRRCDACGTELERLIAANSSFQLKGAGWPGKRIKKERHT